ncbi:pyruvate kinase [Candidatus Uhrbacteria bacterium]|nr:pyruvate kinase [Candidatus Uhrbacteria bacterium]
MPKPIKRTKIVCTLGPASNTAEQIGELVKAGMNVARLNFSHGTHEDHAKMIEKIRAISREMEEPIAILQDLQGPKIRVGELPPEGVTLKTGDKVVFTTGEADIPRKLPVTYAKLHEDVKPGERLLFDDGLLAGRVLSVQGQDVTCEIIDGGVLLSHKGMNLPETAVSASAMSDKDKDDVKFGISQNVDWVALSFVRTAKDIFDLRFLIKQYEEELDIESGIDHPIRIIAKIEKGEAVENIDEIIEAVDGIMVARGDLGIEMRAEEVPLIQKRLIDKCLAAAKPVIVATQMLDSMIRNPRPTRAEVSDIANAVIDHTDAVMLSGETASGKHPLESVETMAKVIRETESSHYDDLENPFENKKKQTTDEAVSQVAKILAKDVGAKGILVASMSGDTGRLVSRHRPELPIFVATDDERVQRQLNLSWGVVPFMLPKCQSVEELVERSLGYLKKSKKINKGEDLIIVAGDPVGVSGRVNLVEIRKV